MTHFHKDSCYATGPGDTEVLICGHQAQAVITAHVCGGKQARICSVTKQPHDMTAIVRFRDGGSTRRTSEERPPAVLPKQPRKSRRRRMTLPADLSPVERQHLRAPLPASPSVSPTAQKERTPK